MAQLTKEEREIVKAFEAGTLQSPPDRSAILKAHREYAAATFRRDRRVKRVKRVKTGDPHADRTSVRF